MRTGVRAGAGPEAGAGVEAESKPDAGTGPGPDVAATGTFTFKSSGNEVHGHLTAFTGELISSDCIRSFLNH